MSRRIERLGGMVVRQSASHRIYEKDGCRTMVAQHGGGRDIPSGLRLSVSTKIVIASLCQTNIRYRIGSSGTMEKPMSSGRDG